MLIGLTGVSVKQSMKTILHISNETIEANEPSRYKYYDALDKITKGYDYLEFRSGLKREWFDMCIASACAMVCCDTVLDGLRSFHLGVL